jgi:hypothetical protein
MYGDLAALYAMAKPARRRTRGYAITLLQIDKDSLRFLRNLQRVTGISPQDLGTLLHFSGAM